MAKLGIFASIVTIVAALGFSAMSSAAPAPCRHKVFKTKMVKEACEAGGQADAKKAMQKWVKTVKIDGKTPSCSKSFCHKNNAPNYDLNDDAYDKFKKAGGEMLAGK